MWDAGKGGGRFVVEGGERGKERAREREAPAAQRVVAGEGGGLQSAKRGMEYPRLGPLTTGFAPARSSLSDSETSTPQSPNLQQSELRGFGQGRQTKVDNPETHSLPLSRSLAPTLSRSFSHSLSLCLLLSPPPSISLSLYLSGSGRRQNTPRGASGESLLQGIDCTRMGLLNPEIPEA